MGQQRGARPHRSGQYIAPDSETFGLKAARNRNHRACPNYDFRSPRLFVDAALAAGATVALERDQSNYLGNVLRLAAGDSVLVFNGRDGEWRARIAGRKRPDSLTIGAQTRPQDRLPDLAYVFAPLKHARLDYMVQKAVEMGASQLQPVLTRFTQVARVNGERMRANVDRGRRAMRHPEPGRGRRARAAGALSRRARRRSACWCSATRRPMSPIPLQALNGAPTAGHGIDVLIGPEGGFAEEERALLLRQPRTLRLSLGPRILRADTAGCRRAGAGAGRAGRLDRRREAKYAAGKAR